MPLRGYKPTSAGRRFMTRSTFEEITTREPYKPLLEPHEAGLRPQQPGSPHRPPSRRRREAPLPDHRLQARQARRAGEGRDGRVRPEPLGPHRAPPLPGRREALHAPAARPQGGRRRRRRPRRRGPGGERPAARQHPARHDDPQHRARARARAARSSAPPAGAPSSWPRRATTRPSASRRGRCAACRSAAWPPWARSRTWTTRTRASARPVGPATWASARRPAVSR